MLLHTQDGVPVNPANPEPVALYGAGGNAITTIAATADMAAANRLLEAAASLYAYDTGSGAPVRLYTASLPAGGPRDRLPAVAGYRSNGATVDPELGNTQGTLLASAARTATTSTGAQINYNARGVRVFINVTANPGGARTLRPYLEFQDPVSATWQSAMVQPAADTLSGIAGGWEIVLYPGCGISADLYSSSANQAQARNSPLPRTWRLTVIHSDATAWTYSASYSLIV